MAALKGTYLGSERESSTRVRNTWGNKLPTINEDRCLMAVVDIRGDFEVIIKVFGRDTLADATCKVSMDGVRLEIDILLVH